MGPGTGPYPGAAPHPAADQQPGWPTEEFAPPDAGQTEQLPLTRPEVPDAGEPALGRAGRNLPVAIGVGVGLGAVVLASLFIWRYAFLALVGLAVVVAIWELVRAVDSMPAKPPVVPLLTGGLAMLALAWFGGVDATLLGLVLTVVALLIWRLGDGPVGYQRDVVVGTLVTAYVPFLASFAVLLLVPDDGARRVTAMLAAVVLSDTGGYVAGVLFGRHPMAPTVSPKKTWEGLAGSVVAATAGGVLLLYFLLDTPWWQGAVFGFAIALAATLGDLTESLVKRDLGVKDLGRLLPGHGGAMDRADSILFAAPTAFGLLSLFVPTGG